MNARFVSLFLALALATGDLVGFSGCAKFHDHAAESAAAATTYQCPMHP